MLRKIRILLAAIVIVSVTMLFIGIGGWHKWAGWLAHVQFLPAVLALNVVVVVVLLLLTLLFGRWYCSVLCPLGVMQDVVSSVYELNKLVALWNAGCVCGVAFGRIKYCVCSAFTI